MRLHKYNCQQMRLHEISLEFNCILRLWGIKCIIFKSALVTLLRWANVIHLQPPSILVQTFKRQLLWNSCMEWNQFHVYLFMGVGVGSCSEVFAQLNKMKTKGYNLFKPDKNDGADIFAESKQGLLPSSSSSLFNS